MQTMKTKPRKGLQHRINQIKNKLAKNVNKYFQKKMKMTYSTQGSS
jgi:hypothetical protein